MYWMYKHLYISLRWSHGKDCYCCWILLLWDPPTHPNNHFYQQFTLCKFQKPLVCVMTTLVICFHVCTNLHQDQCKVLYIVGELRVWGSVWDFVCELNICVWGLGFKRYEALIAHKHALVPLDSTAVEQRSLAVIEMTDVAAGGKTCKDYYGLFGVVVWKIEHHLISCLFTVCFHRLISWES